MKRPKTATTDFARTTNAVEGKRFGHQLRDTKEKQRGHKKLNKGMQPPEIKKENKLRKKLKKNIFYDYLIINGEKF